MSEKINDTIEMQITSIEELKRVAKGQVVRLPGFVDDVPFVVRIVRPSMLDMVTDGSIPNPLIKTASKLFMRGTGSINESDASDMKGFTQLLDAMCERALVEPTMAQIREAGVSLTDEQKGAILQYVLHGVNALESFRRQSGNKKAADGVKQVQKKTK